MKILITYKSYYGSSKQYALWLSEELNCEAKSLDEIKLLDLKNYDLIIHGGGLYAGGLSGISFYKKNLSFLKENNIKLICFACGASPSNKKVIAEMAINIFKGDMKDIPYFYCEGNYDYSVMSFIHKQMMKMMNKWLTKKIKKAEKPNPMDVEFQGLIFSHFERVDKKWIKQIIDYINSLQ